MLQLIRPGRGYWYTGLVSGHACALERDPAMEDTRRDEPKQLGRIGLGSRVLTQTYCKSDRLIRSMMPPRIAMIMESLPAELIHSSQQTSVGVGYRKSSLHWSTVYYFAAALSQTSRSITCVPFTGGQVHSVSSLHSVTGTSRRRYNDHLKNQPVTNGLVITTE